MGKYLQNLRYIARHKWFVFRECCRLGIPITGLLHDWHKLRPSEFFPYAENFYGGHPPSRPKTVLDAFNYAWLQHISRCRHHWEWYVLGFDKDTKRLLVFEMPMRYRKEMLADWRGVHAALGKDPIEDTKRWYEERKDSMVLGEETRRWIEEQIAKG